MHPDVLHQLVIRREGLQALLALVRLHVAAGAPAAATGGRPAAGRPRALVAAAREVAAVKVHGRLSHQVLKEEGEEEGLDGETQL